MVIALQHIVAGASVLVQNAELECQLLQQDFNHSTTTHWSVLSQKKRTLLRTQVLQKTILPVQKAHSRSIILYTQVSNTGFPLPCPFSVFHTAMTGKEPNHPPMGNVATHHNNILGLQVVDLKKLQAVFTDLMKLLCSKRDGMSATEMEQAIKLQTQGQAMVMTSVLKISMAAATAWTPPPPPLNAPALAGKTSTWASVAQMNTHKPVKQAPWCDDHIITVTHPVWECSFTVSEEWLQV